MSNETTAAQNTQQVEVHNGQTTEVSMTAGQALAIAATGADIQGMSLGQNGELVISFSHGSSIVVKNFAEMATQDHPPAITLPSGQTIELASLLQTLQSADHNQHADATPVGAVQEVADMHHAAGHEVTIHEPKHGENVVVKLQDGTDYKFAFDMTEAASVKNHGGELVITFKHGGEIIIPNYGDMSHSGAHVPQMTMNDGTQLSVQDFGDMLAAATQLNQVEPAAGNNGGGAAPGGFGFESVFQSSALHSLNAIGPIDPTALQYQAPDRTPTPYLNDTIKAPTLEAADVWVKEDSSVQLDIHAHLNNPASGDHLTIVVTGFLPGWTVDTSASGGTYDAATHTWTLDLPAGTTSFAGGPTVSPPANSDADMPHLDITATASNSAGSLTAVTTGTENVYTDAVVDPVTLTASNSAGDENHTIPLSINLGASADTDGSEHVTNVTISGVPAGATLNHGTYDAATGNWTLTTTDLTGLTVTPAHGYHGDMNLTVSVTEQETSLSGLENDYTDNTATTTTHLTVTVNDTIEKPTVSATDVWVKEDHSVQLNVDAHLNDAQPGDHLTVTIAGFDPNWTVDTTASGGTYDAATHTWTIDLPAGTTNFSGGPTVTPPANSDADMSGLTVTATASDGTVSASSTATENVFTDAVVDPVTLTASNSTGDENHSIALSINIGASADTDGSEHVTNVTISGVPAGATLNHGTYDAGTGDWTLTTADLTGLAVTPAHGYHGDMNLTVSVTEQETVLSGAENDYTDNTATVTTNLTVTVNNTIDTPTVSSTDVWVKEDHSVQLNVNAHLNDPATGDHLTVTIAGFDPNWTVDTTTSGGTYDATTHTWTIDLPAGTTSFSGGPTVTPPANSDADMTGLTVTATASDGLISSSSSVTENVFTDAVVDPVTVTAHDASGLEDHTVALNISLGASADTDGSEHITKIVLTGVPDGATLNHGAYDAATHSWSLTPADLSGLTVTPAAGYHGDMNITVAVTEQETNLSGLENDYTDNTATTTAHLTVSIGDTIEKPTVSATDVWVKEDHSVQLSVDAHLNNPATGDHLTVTIGGIQAGWTVDTSASGGTYDAASHTWTITLPDGVTSFSGGPTVTPPANSDADMTGLTVTATASDGTVSASTTATENVFTDAVVDPVAVTAHNASGAENHDIALSINIGASADTDGSEHVTKVVITGVPDGATLNHGSYDAATHSWTLSQADLSGLKLTPATDYHGSFNLTVAVTEQETSLSGAENDYTDNTAVTTTQMSVTVNDVVDKPTVSATDVWVKEDHSVQLSVDAHLNNPSAADHLTVTIAGFDPSWTVDTSASGGTYDAAAHTWTIDLPAGVTSFSGGPVVSPPANSDADMTGLTVTATASDGIVSSSTTATENVFTDAVVDPVSLTVHDASGTENSTIGLSINVGPSADTDGSEHVTQILVSGIPAGATLNHGTYDAATGDWTLTRADLSGLTITPAHGYHGDMNLTVSVTEKETSLSGAENDYTDNTATTTAHLTVGVGDTISSPFVCAHDVWVKEDGSVQLHMDAHLSDPAAGDVLTVTISGFQPGWGVDTSASGGTYDAATHTWTLTLPAGTTSFSGGPVVTPPANSDVDMGALNMTATASDGNVSASTTDYSSVYVDAVVDPVTVTAHDASGDAGSAIGLSINIGASADHDGSEHVTKIVLTGVPDTATLNHGTYDAATHSWSLTPADLTGLTLTTANGYNGTLNLTVAVTEQETALNGAENDLTDNTATTTAHLSVAVHDSVPVILSTPASTVDETDLTGAHLTVSNDVSANYFGDGPGAITATGAASFSAGGSLLGGHLTSGGEAVHVTQSGNVYTGTTTGGSEVFTFTIDANGHYTFDLEGVLDHANASNPNDVINLNFGVTATDADGDTATGTVTVHVVDDAPIAHDDHNTFDLGAGHASGNVVSGLNGGAGAADTQSHDAANHVTQVSFGSTVVDVPGTGTATIHGDHGTLVISSDGSYTYTLDGGSSSGSGGTVTDTPHTFTGNSFPTDLHESSAIGAADQADLGELHSNMVINANTQVTGQITFDGAGYTNSLGAFTIAADGSLQAVQMIAPSITGTGANFNVDAAASAQELGFFLVADGYTNNGGYSGLDFSTGTLSFVHDYGQADQRTATVNDGGNNVSLVFTDAGGVDHVISGPVYFTTDRGGSNSLNADGVVHTLSGVGSDSHTLTIAFEDLPSGGDHDYNDTIFNVQMTDHVVSPPTDTTDQFHYTLTDADGDHSTALLDFQGIAPVLTVGENVNDGGSSTVPYEVGTGHGTITGGGAGDILIGDVGGATQSTAAHDYNINLILDVSGSMGSLSDHNSKLSLLVKAVDHMLTDLHNYTGGAVEVHITPFTTTALGGGTFTVTDDLGFAQALDFLTHMGGGGTTNYESALQAGNAWLASGEPIHDATTVSYFITDGEPNEYVTDGHPAVSGSESVAMGQILGSDGTNEVADIQHLSDQVIGVGIDVGSKISNIDQIDSSGHALNVTDPTDLDAVLTASSPLNHPNAVGGDHIVGGDGNDIIFGDSVNTDGLASAEGLHLAAGSGWETFAALEAGQGIDSGWTRADTVDYINNHALALSAETLGSDGQGRLGGNDVLEGGLGDDLIFGQEGNDTIDGGAGHNTLYGGSGSDTFLISTVDGVNTIKDFNAASGGDKLDISHVLSGFDPLTDALHNFVHVDNTGGNTIVSVDPTGTGAAFHTVAVLEGVTIDVDTLAHNGNLIA
jgi:T1SS-143 domain-containing protein